MTTGFHSTTSRKICVCSFTHKKDDLTSQVQTRSVYIFFYCSLILGYEYGLSLVRNKSESYEWNTKYRHMPSQLLYYYISIHLYSISSFHIHLHNRLNGNTAITFYFKLSSITSTEKLTCYWTAYTYTQYSDRWFDAFLWKYVCNGKPLLLYTQQKLSKA